MKRVAWVLVLSLAGFLLAGCPGGNEGALPPPDDSPTRSLQGTLTDATLNELADEAWLESGLTGDPTVVTAGSADSVSGTSVTAVDQELDGAVLSAGFSIQLGATGGLTLPKSDAAIRNGVSHTIDPALTPTPSTTYDLTGTYACPGGGTVELDGAVVVTVQQTLAEDGITVVSGSIRTLVDNLVVRFHACTDASVTRRVWGTGLVDTDNMISAAERPAEPGVYDIALDVDELVQAGLVYEDVANPGVYFRLLLRYSRTGALDAVRDTSLKLTDPGGLLIYGSLTANTKLNDATCSTVVTFDGDPATGTVTKGCTVP